MWKPPFAARSLAGAAALTVLCSCSKPPEPAPVAPPTPVPPAVTPPTPTPAVTPTPVGTPTPTPIVHHYAPDGIYYVTEEVTVRLRAGLLGIAPGTQVHLVRKTGDTATVNDGTQDFEIKMAQLTNDLEEAAKIQKNAQSVEAAGSAFQQQQQAAFERQQRAQIEFLRTHPLSGNTTPTPTPPRR